MNELQATDLIAAVNAVWTGLVLVAVIQGLRLLVDVARILSAGREGT